MSEAARCTACLRVFRPDPHNAYHQECCTRPDCVRERKRRRQREWYRAKYQGNRAFREREIRRLVAWRRKGQGRDPPGEGQAGWDVAVIGAALTGLVAQLADSAEPAVVRGILVGYVDRGRRLATAPVWSSTS